MHLFHHLPDVNSGQYSLVTALHCELQPSTFSSIFSMTSHQHEIANSSNCLSVSEEANKIALQWRSGFSITHLIIHANCPLRFKESQITSFVNHNKLVANHYWHQGTPSMNVLSFH